MPYTPTTWQDLPSTATPVTAAELNRIEAGVRDAYDHRRPVVNALTYYAAAAATGPARLAALHAARDAAIAAKVPLYFPAADYDIGGGALDLRASRLTTLGEGPLRSVIRQGTADTPCILFGGAESHLEGVGGDYPTQAGTGDSNSVGLKLYDGFMCRLANIAVQRTHTGVQIAQEDWPVGGPSQNTFFSYTVDTIRVLGFRNRALDLRSYVGASTPSFWANVYLHNNYAGPNENATSHVIAIEGHDGIHFTNVGIEWTNLTTTPAVLVNGASATFDAVHFEGVVLSAAGTALFNVYDRGLLTVRSLSVQNTTFSGGGQSILLSGGGSGTGTSTVMPRTRVDGWRWLGSNPAPTGNFYLHRSQDSTICRAVIDPHDPRAPLTALRGNGGASSVVVVDGVSGT